MNPRRAGPGPQLSAGHLRVDAARAIAKLREYQLADRTAWILEAVRAAVAAGATRIALDGDSNDVWLYWDGEPWPAADLPRLFDELVSPEAAGEHHHVRLLAAAVNSALGLHPAYVDVFAVTATGSAIRARYTPDVLDTPAAELGDAPLHRIAAEPATPPAGTTRGMAVHLRRRVGLEVLSYLFRHEPPELALARVACQDIAVPLRVGGANHQAGSDELGRHRPRHDVVRVPLGEDLDGFVAVTDPIAARSPVAMSIAERGVVLATSAIDLGIADGQAALPLRVFIDAPRMPTNASRSQVRHEGHPLPAAARRARAVLPALIAALVAELADDRPPAIRERARAAALALIAASSRRWSWGFLRSNVLRPLAQLPLVRDATGQPRPVDNEWRGFAHTGRSPLPDELAPWLDDVLWIPPGDASAYLVPAEAVDPQALRQHVRFARREQRARRRFLGHATREARIAPRQTPRIRARLGASLERTRDPAQPASAAPVTRSCVDDAWFEGLTGEVCIHAAGDSGELVLLLEGRELERIEFASQIAFSMVIDDPRLAPAERYRAALRDASYRRVERAMRAGVLRAMEAVVLAEAGATLPDGFAAGPSIAPDEHARSVRAAIALASELAARMRGPLATAPAWRCADGTWTDLAALCRCEVIGTMPPDASLVPPRGRIVVHASAAEHDQLAKLAPATTVVRYDPARSTARQSAHDLATRMLAPTTQFALAIREDDRAIAVAPAMAPRLHLYHHGVKLADRHRSMTVVPCSIAVDADAAVPDATWTSIHLDGHADADLVRWEIALVRAIASSLVGARPPELFGDGAIDLGGELGEALCVALAYAEPVELLGAELADKLRAAPMLRVLGEARPWTADALAAAFPNAIPYVDALAAPVAGFTPLCGDLRLAHAIGKLVGRRVVEGTAELERRRRAAVRAVHLADHRTTAPRPLQLPDAAITVPLASAHGRGVVGIARRGSCELHVFVEGRPFRVLRPDAPPVVAVIDVAETCADETFGELRDSIAGELTTDVRRAIPALVIAIARAAPRSLVELGEPRTLLANCLDGELLGPEVRDELARLLAFPAIQGGAVTLAQRPDAIEIAAWDGDWLGPDPGKFDPAVIHVPHGAGELRAIVSALHRFPIIDATEAVAKLQAQRRMARGLLPVPSVPGATAEVKRRLAELGDVARALGPGEIALVDAPVSLVLLHVHGELRRRAELPGVFPTVYLAIEAPDLVARLERDERDDQDDVATALAQLRAPGQLPRSYVPQAQELATVLVQQIVAATPHTRLPAWVRRTLRCALLSNHAFAPLADVALFPIVTGTWVTWRAIAAQIELVGDAWAVAGMPANPSPLDPRRFVLLLDASEQQLARRLGLPVIEATHELALDLVARTKRARPPAQSLAIDPADGVLATMSLDGDGTSGPRGVVGVLAPEAAHRRTTLVHRALHPFDPVTDVCRWPTIAVVDDARLIPDRTWSQAVQDATWKQLAQAIRAASETALRTLFQAPAGALEIEPITWASHIELSSLREAPNIQLRGLLWLAGPPGLPGVVELRTATGRRTFSTPRRVAVSGSLLVHTPADEPRALDSLDRVLDELCAAGHAALVKKLVLRTNLAPDLVAAHVAHALALDRITPASARSIRFACFRPEPFDAGQLAAVLRGPGTIPLIDPGPDAVANELSIADDGSELARLVLAWLGPRVRRDRRAPRALQPLPASAPPPAAPPLLAAPARPRPSHPLDILVAALSRRLAEIGVPVGKYAIIEGERDPILRVDGGLCLAADHPQLRAIAAACLARTAWASAAVDALAAHAVTVLNVALTSVTDATEAHALGALLAGS